MPSVTVSYFNLPRLLHNMFHYFHFVFKDASDQGVEPNPNLNREPVKAAFFR